MRGPSLVAVLCWIGACPPVAAPVSGPAPPRSIEVHGHRGCRGLRPENTLPAFEHAIELGVDVLELDLSLSLDDVLVVSHEPEVTSDLCQESRPLRSHRLRDLSWEEIRSLDCGSQRNPRFAEQVAVPGARMPRLEEVLELLERHPWLRVNVEIKTFPDRRELTRTPAEFAVALVDLIGQRGLQGRVMVQSFDAEALQAVSQLDPGLALSALVERREDIEPMLEASGARTLSPLHTLLSSVKDVRAFQGRSLRVVPWTVNEPADLQRLVNWGVDGLITDYPDRLLALLGRLQPFK